MNDTNRKLNDDSINQTPKNESLPNSTTDDIQL